MQHTHLDNVCVVLGRRIVQWRVVIGAGEIDVCAGGKQQFYNANIAQAGHFMLQEQSAGLTLLFKLSAVPVRSSQHGPFHRRLRRVRAAASLHLRFAYNAIS